MKTQSALAAAAIRKELKAAYPLIKFSVTSDNYAGGDAVHISWTDGAQTDEVRKITDKYQLGDTYTAIMTCARGGNSQAN